MALAIKPNPYSGASSPWYIQAWTTTPVAVDILAQGPGNPTSSNFGYPCRRIAVQTGGTLVVTDTSGNVRTLTCANGEVLDIEATALGPSSTAQGVKVYW